MKRFKEFMKEVNGLPKTELERVMIHFDISKEKFDKLSKEEIQKLINKLPPKGTGRK